MILKTPVFSFASALLALLLASPALGQWSLNNEASSLSFVTIKADHVAEVHTFDQLSGSIGSDGSVAITIELASVNTLIDIRNERMRNMLFETNLFPDARISASLDIGALAGMATGSSRTMQVEFQLDLHGQSNSYTADLLVSRLQGGLVASTLKPVVVNADSYSLVTGVEALREVAGLPSISRAVPVSFTVVFNQGR